MRKISFIFIFLFFFLQIKIPCLAKEFAYVHIVDYANPTPLKEIQEKYQAKDYLDGDITKQLIFITEYDETTCTVQDYPLTVSVTNSQMNTTILQDVISVRDFIGPEISLISSEISIDLSNPSYLEQIRNNLILTDNLDTEFHTIIYDGIENLNQGPGEYYLHIYAIDSSTNHSNSQKLLIHAYQSITEEILTSTLEFNEKPPSETDILSILLQKELIKSDYETIQLESNYFTKEKNGVYKLCINTSYKDGTFIKYYGVLKINLKSSSKDKDSSFIAGISCIVLGTLFLFGCILYKKRS